MLYTGQKRSAYKIQASGWPYCCQVHVECNGGHPNANYLVPRVALTTWYPLTQCYDFLVTVLQSLPSESPLDKRWPVITSTLFKDTSELLRVLHHKWRVCRTKSLRV